MIHRNICPICGNENPENSEFCQVCKANLQNLPDELFKSEPDPVGISAEPKSVNAQAEADEFSPDSPVPAWLADRLQKKDQQPRQEFDFNSYTDALFGVTASGKNSSAPKSPKAPRRKKKESAYQPQLDNLTEAPLMEVEENDQKTVPNADPALNDFRVTRPVKKWDDPKQDKIIESVREQNKREFETVNQPLLWWQQDAPLTEEGDPAEAKAAEDDPELINSASPTKLVDAEDIPGLKEETMTAEEPSPETVEGPSAGHTDENFMPENGSLISDLMNAIDQGDGDADPDGKEEPGTVFYSGNEVPEETPAEEEIINLEATESAANASAAALDQILRGFGFQPESEVNGTASPNENTPEETAEADTVQPGPEGFDADPADVSAGEPSDEGAGITQVLPERDVREKEEELEEQEIPWDLFSSADMSFPQSPEDPDYRTFSRSGIPAEAVNTSYQQRMMSSVLSKIIQAENFVPQPQKTGTRKLSLAARLVWSILALTGVIVILLTGVTDSWKLPPAAVTKDAGVFYAQAENAEGDVLLVMDYTPAYSAELDNAAEGLIKTLENGERKLSLAVLNPAVMVGARRLLENHAETVTFAGWWPASIISIRARAAAGEIPQNVWLLTADIGSVRNWAEQLVSFDKEAKLHVLASGQLEPLLQPYLESGLVSSALSRDMDALNYGSVSNGIGRTQFAVWYLAALLPLAWLCGLITKFLKSDPNYGRKKNSGKDLPPFAGGERDSR